MTHQPASAAPKSFGNRAWAWFKTPGGVFWTVFIFLVCFWGTAIFLLSINLIKLSNQYQQDLWKEICMQILNGLFAATSVLPFPWRIVDMYRISKIIRLRRIVRKRREQRNLPALTDKNDLLDPSQGPSYVSVLDKEEQDALVYQQMAFSKSNAWYKPHNTDTHKAVSISLAFWICVVMILNSIFQSVLCGFMWGMSRFDRPQWINPMLVALATAAWGVAAGLSWYASAKSTRKHTNPDPLEVTISMRGAGSSTTLKATGYDEAASLLV